MEIHHIDQNGGNSEDNGIPLCLDCHAEVRAYNPSHPKGRKYSASELRKHRDQWFELWSVNPFLMQSQQLNRTSVVKEKDMDEKPDEDSWAPYEDNIFQIFDQRKNSIVRNSSKTSYLGPLASIPVFVPEFTLIPPPHAFGSKSVFVTSRPGVTCTVQTFELLASELMEKWKDGDLRTLDRMVNWSISEPKKFYYGCGINNLIEEIPKHERATFGAVLVGNFGEHFDQTFFMDIYGYHKDNLIIYFGIDFYLRTVPVNWNWFQSIFNSFERLGKKKTIEQYSFVGLPVFSWHPKKAELEIDALGGLRKTGFKSPKYDVPEEDLSYSGIITNNKPLLKTDYELEIRCDDPEYIQDFKDIENPISILGESVLSITNPVPTIEETKNLKKIRSPEIKMIPLSMEGGTIFALTVHSGWFMG